MDSIHSIANYSYFKFENATAISAIVVVALKALSLLIVAGAVLICLSYLRKRISTPAKAIDQQPQKTPESPVPAGQAPQPPNISQTPESPLLAFGQFRKGTGEGEPPNFTATCDVIESEKLYTAAFACCFHTTESHQEIWKLINGICIEDKKRTCSFTVSENDNFPVSHGRWYNNLVSLHDALPGEPKAKSVKIYWNDRVKDILFPHLFNNENIDVTDLVFAQTAGEANQGLFQAPEIDFSKQLQFVGIGKVMENQPSDHFLHLHDLKG